MTWKESLIGLPLALLGAILLVATAAGGMLTRTSWGRENVRAYVLEKLNGSIRGRVEIDAVLEGDLLRMVRMAGVRIYEADGREFARIDTVSVHYRWSDFLIGDITLTQVTLIGPVLDIRISPDTGWNFIEIFRGNDPPTPDREAGSPDAGRRIFVREARLRSADITIRSPWEASVDPDSVRWHLEQHAGRWERVMRVEGLDARLRNARLDAPGREGRSFPIAEFSGVATIIGEPIEVERLRADIEVIRDTLSFQLWEGNLPDTHVFGQGWVTLASEPEYELILQGDPVTTRDLMWLVPQLPEGEARLDFHLLSRRDGFLIEAEDARWQSIDAAASGRFSMSVRDRPDGLRLNDVDVEIERAHTSMIEHLTGWELPASGELSGRVAVDGSLATLQVRADLFARSDSASPPSHVVANGFLLGGPESLGARELAVEVDDLELDLLRAFVPGLSVRGRVSGKAELDGRLAEGVQANLTLEQRDGRLTPTRIRGNGRLTIDGQSPARLNADVTVDTLSLATLAEYVPAIPIRGDFRGKVAADGSLDDLAIDARLVGFGDSLHVNGQLQVSEGRTRYGGSVKGWGLDLPEFRPGIAASDVDFTVDVEGTGVSAEEIDARAQARLSASWVGGVLVDSASAHLRIAGGSLLVDTAATYGPFGELRLSGGLRLVDGEADSLQFDLNADSLATLESWFFPEVEDLATPNLVLASGAGTEAPEVARARGAARLEGWVVRNQGRFSLRCSGRGADLVYADFAADSVQVDRLEVVEIEGGLGVRGAISGWGLGMGELRFRTAKLQGELAEGRARLDFELANEGASASGRLWAALTEEFREFGLDTLEVRLGRSLWSLVEPGSFRLGDDGAVEVKSLSLRSSIGSVSLAGFVGVSGPAEFELKVSGLNLADLARLWPDSLGVGGMLELDARLSGRVRAPVLRGDFEIRDGRLFGVEFSALRGEVGFEGGKLATEASLWDEDGRMAGLSGTLPFEFRLPSFGFGISEREMDLTLDGDSIPLRLALLFTDQIADVGGFGRGSVRMRGTPDRVQLDGAATLFRGAFRVIRTGIPYSELQGDLDFEGQAVRLSGIDFRSRQGGSATATGTVTFTSLSNPTFDLRLGARALPVYDQLDARAVVSGELTLQGVYEAPRVGGRLSVVSGVLYVEEIGRQREIVNLFDRSFKEDSLLWGAEDARRPSESPFVENLTMDLAVSVAQDTWLRSAEMNVEIGGDVVVETNPGQEEWTITGTLNAIRGDYRLFNKRFHVSSGSIDFPGLPGFNPSLRIVALYTVQTEKQPILIRLIIGGTLEDMTLALESDHRPPLPESDLLSYLMFGRPAFELTRSSEERDLLGDVTAGVPQALVGYALSSLLVGEAGIAYVDVSRVTPRAQTVEGEPQSVVSTALAATQVEVGWYLAPTVFVSVAQHLAGAVRPTVRLDWRLDDHVTLRGIAEPRFGDEEVLFTDASETSLEQSIGVFIFYGWSY